MPTALQTDFAALGLQDLTRPTPLVDRPALAASMGVASITIKDESKRYLGNFKSLGGIYASFRALARSRVQGCGMANAQPQCLICASDGNHGLAVATAARRSGMEARIFLHCGVDAVRAARIRRQGAKIVRVRGTYDDAVDAARLAANKGQGLLIADTSDDPADSIVLDILAGYGLIAEEILGEYARRGTPAPTHVFIQAGVGGLAAAIARGLRPHMTGDRRVVTVEPATSACVRHALRTGKPERMAGTLKTSAEMLSCGTASASALAILLQEQAFGIAVSEALLTEAVCLLATYGGPVTTESGATGLAGLLAAAPGTPLGQSVGLTGNSHVLLVVSEGTPDKDAPW